MNQTILGVLLAFIATTALAQDFPSKPVRLISPNPAGGPNDVLARLYAQKLGELGKGTYIVENRVGATGSIGADHVVKAAPDGYTALFTVDLPIVMAPSLFKVPYDPVRDLVPVLGVTESMNLLAVNPALNIGSLAELVAAAKAKPDLITFASAGNASPGHVCGEMIRVASGAPMTHVPYKGASPAATAVISGEVSMFCGPVPMLAAHVRSGKLRGLGVTGTHASPIAPNLAPLATTFPGLVVSNWYALFVPAKTPAVAVDHLRNAFRQVTDDPEIRKRLTGMGLDVRLMDAPQVTEAIKTDLVRWSKVIREAAIKAD
jgi:tripartite-type tricarboxylate transporter receptor subunit TctC